MRRLLLTAVADCRAYDAAHCVHSRGIGTSFAQAWPTKPIKVVVPLTAGSATDVMARIVFDEVSKQVGQTDRDREPARRRQLDRHERGRQGRSRRLHHPRQFLDAHRVARGARHHAARHRQRSFRHHPARQHAGGDPVQPEEGLQAAQRLRELGQGQSGQGELLVGRRRQLVAPQRRAVQARRRASRRCTCRSRARRRR